LANVKKISNSADGKGERVGEKSVAGTETERETIKKGTTKGQTGSAQKIKSEDHATL